MKRALALTLLLFGFVYVVACFRYAPPASVPRDAAPDRFSADRAADIQQRLAGDGETRYVTSPANTRARAIIKEELQKIGGWEVDFQSATSCTYHGMCAPITNVIGKLVGENPSLPAVLLTAHYDSVPVSPGASDDGVGTTTLLETARALAQGAAPKRPLRTVIIALVDGEEAGLLGSDAFVKQNPLAKTVGTTINVDARGSHGPSQMFETSAWGNGWLIDLVAKHVDRPVTTSLYYEVYKRMPNDTDFTATKTIASGVNFANTAGIEHYHTPLDSLATADRGTLQHHGDHVLGMARALANESVTHAHDGSEKDVVWFDVLALGVVKWPESYSVMIALIALMLIAGQGIRARVFDRGVGVFFMALVPGLIASLAAGLLLKGIGATPAPWVAHPIFGLVTIHSATILGSLGIANELAKKSSPRALWLGTWLGWGVLGVATAFFVPGASYLFVVPAIAAAITGPLILSRIEIACIVPAVVAAVLVLALSTATYDAVGFTAPPLLALPTMLLATTIAPMLPGVIPPRFTKKAMLAMAAVCILSAIAALIAPKFSAASQQRVNVVFRQDEGTTTPATGPTARVFVDTTWGPAVWGAPPDAMMSAVGAAGSGAGAREPSLPWMLPSSFGTVSPIGDLKAPTVEIINLADSGGVRRVRARLRSSREASTLAVVFPPNRHVGVRVDGRTAYPRPIANGGSVVGLLGVGKSGIEVDFDATGTDPIPMTILDRTYGVPPGTKAEDAVRARTNEATPYQDGDVTVVSKALSI